MFPVIKSRAFGNPYFGIDQFFNEIPVKDFFQSSLRNGFNTPSANIREDEKQFVIDLAAPGFAKNEFNIKVENETLHISAEKTTEKTNESERFTRKEFNYGKFMRSFNLPETVDVSSITAEYANGILNVILPKRQEEKKENTLQIEIK